MKILKNYGAFLEKLNYGSDYTLLVEKLNDELDAMAQKSDEEEFEEEFEDSNEYVKFDFAGKVLELFGHDIEPEDLDEIRQNLEVLLSDYKDDITELMTSGNKKELGIKYTVRELKENMDMVIRRELNIVEFLRMIKNIINIPKRKMSHKLEILFELYIDSLPGRFARLFKILSGKKRPLYLDKPEELDKSVLDKEDFEKELRALQVQLNRLQKSLAEKKKRLLIVFEGRDAAGKGAVIKAFTRYLPVKGFKVVTFGIPTKEEMEGDNWFKRYEKHFPKNGEIVFFDRSWYSMALVNPTMGYCSEEQYKYFMEHVNQFEENILKQGIDLVKFWFSVSQEKQLIRFKLRQDSELKYWKFSKADMESIDKWEVFTKYKEQCFNKTSTAKNPWVIVNSNDKRLAKLNAVRYILDLYKYEGKDKSMTKVFPEIVYELR